MSVSFQSSLSWHLFKILFLAGNIWSLSNKTDSSFIHSDCLSLSVCLCLCLCLSLSLSLLTASRLECLICRMTQYCLAHSRSVVLVSSSVLSLWLSLSLLILVPLPIPVSAYSSSYRSSLSPPQRELASVCANGLSDGSYIFRSSSSQSWSFCGVQGTGYHEFHFQITSCVCYAGVYGGVCASNITSFPTPQPTRKPTLSPSSTPSLAPTATPSVSPTTNPSANPTALPTFMLHPHSNQQPLQH